MKKTLSVFALCFLYGCGVGSLPSASNDTAIKIASKSPDTIELVYSSCLFCMDLPQKANDAAQMHCANHNATAIFVKKRKSEFYDTDYFFCAAKKVTYEEKKEKAKKECVDMGFRTGTDDFANCVLKLVSKDF